MAVTSARRAARGTLLRGPVAAGGGDAVRGQSPRTQGPRPKDPAKLSPRNGRTPATFAASLRAITRPPCACLLARACSQASGLAVGHGAPKVRP